MSAADTPIPAAPAPREASGRPAADRHRGRRRQPVVDRRARDPDRPHQRHRPLIGVAGRQLLLVVAEPHEQPRPEHRHRGAAGHRRDRRDRRRRARHLDRLDRERGVGGLGDRRSTQGVDRHCSGPGSHAVRRSWRGSRRALFCGVDQRASSSRVLNVNPDHRDAGHAGRVRRTRVPHRARGQARGRRHAAGLHLAGDRRGSSRPGHPRLGGRPWPGVPDRLRDPDRGGRDHAHRHALHGLRPVGLRDRRQRDGGAPAGINLRTMRIAHVHRSPAPSPAWPGCC